MSIPPDDRDMLRSVHDLGQTFAKADATSLCEVITGSDPVKALGELEEVIESHNSSLARLKHKF